MFSYVCYYFVIISGANVMFFLKRQMFSKVLFLLVLNFLCYILPESYTEFVHSAVMVTDCNEPLS